MMGNQQVGRLAMRVEGDWWVGYYAAPDTMEEAFELGRIRMAIVEDQTRKWAFMDILKSVIGDFLAERFGERPDWPEVRPAPEHERSGRG